MTTFSGLCIGGPLAGRRLTSFQPSILVPVLGDAPPLSSGPHDEVELVRYEHEEFSIGREAVRFGFWRLSDMTLAQLLTELAKAYEEKHANAS